MIAFVRGKFINKTPARVVVDVNGVGYDLQISLNTYSEIEPLAEGTLFTYWHWFENGQTFYGFATEAEKEMFLQLISVSGVGAATARMMLSGMKPTEIARAIVQGNAKQLEAIKGIGKKSAERLIVELKDKLAKLVNEQQASLLKTPLEGHQSDAIDALMALGINKNMAENAVKKVTMANANIPLETLIKLALKNL
ncbi:MAG: Holliday junction branch migration protein RuvA [Chitinophagaceae bacterium]